MIIEGNLEPYIMTNKTKYLTNVLEGKIRFYNEFYYFMNDCRIQTTKINPENLKKIKEFMGLNWTNKANIDKIKAYLRNEMLSFY